MPTKRHAAARYFDISHLTGDSRPVSLATIIRENGGAENMDPGELRRLRSCPVGGRVNLGVTGQRAHVTFVRVRAPAAVRRRKRK